MCYVEVPGELLRAAAADALRVRDRGALVCLHLVRHRPGGPQERHAVRLALDVGQQGCTIGRRPLSLIYKLQQNR